MKFTGVLGILVFLGIAYFFSKNRKAINLYTVIWGLALQILFALAILGSPFWSFGATLLLILLVTVYLGYTRFSPLKPNISPLLISVISVIKILTIIFIGYICGTVPGSEMMQAVVTPFVSILWAIFALVWCARKFIKNEKFQTLPINTTLFILALSLSFGGSFAIAQVTEYTQGTMVTHMDALSRGFGEFLRIPTAAGSGFMYGQLADMSKFGFLFFVHALSAIIFFSAFISILYYFGIVQILVLEMARFMRWTMRTSGAETLSCSANIFIGQTEAPILVKPFVSGMTQSELHAVMTGGFATIAGSVFAGFVQMGIDAGYLLGASVMSAPAALMISKIWYPETETSKTSGDVDIPNVQISDNVVGAAAAGTSDGIQLAINVGGMLIAFIAIIRLINMGLSVVDPSWSLELMLGFLFQPIAFIMGAPIQDVQSVGSLLGMKIAINEFVAYISLGEMIADNTITTKSQIIATYALCGFANFASIGIQVAGISYMAPDRRSDITRLGFSAMIAGAFASWITACIAGILLG